MLAPDKSEAFKAFIAAHPEYDETSALDALREREFARLDAQGQIYIDYTGSGLYGSSQVERHAETICPVSVRISWPCLSTRWSATRPESAP